MAQTLDILVEPEGPVYLRLLAFAERHSLHFTLVWRHQVSFDDRAAAVEAALEPFLIEKVEPSTWPGTTLLAHSATVRMYRVCRGSLRELARAERLFAWQAPKRPEDLAFYAGDSGAWLGSIAHEGDAFVVVDPADLDVLEAAVPGLQLKPSARLANSLQPTSGEPGIE